MADGAAKLIEDYEEVMLAANVDRRTPTRKDRLSRDCSGGGQNLLSQFQAAAESALAFDSLGFRLVVASAF